MFSLHLAAETWYGYGTAMRSVEGPLYRAIASRVEARVLAGRYPPGSTLPAEAVLEREFGVSRITIRHALGLLKRRGVLYSRSGLGTLVRRDGVAPDRVRMTGSLTDLIVYGGQTTYEAVSRRVVPPPAEVAHLLELTGSEERVVAFRGVRSRRGARRFCFEEIFIPCALGRALDNRKPGWRTLFSLLEEVNGFQIAEAHQAISAARAPQAVRRHLGMPVGRPALRLVRVYRTSAGNPVEVAVSYYDPSRFEYAMTLYRG